jgi:hypothetical protein
MEILKLETLFLTFSSENESLIQFYLNKKFMIRAFTTLKYS